MDTYIKFDGIDGESTQVDHKGEINVLAWAWGLTATASPVGGGAGAGKSTPRELTFRHACDKASPLLAKSAAQGKRVKTAVLTVRKSGEGQKDFLRVTLKEVFITSVSISGSTGPEGPVEDISLAFSEVGFGYKPQDDKGALGPEVAFTWNTKTAIIT